MKLLIHDKSHLEIKLSLKEKLISNHISFRKIPIINIKHVSNDIPEMSNNDYRDGLPIPNIKAGTLVTPRGYEFWYVDKKHPNYLIMDLFGENFHRIVLTTNDNVEIKEKIERLIGQN